MLIFRTYECPECEQRFELMQEREEGPPRFCVHCGADFSDEELPAIPAKVSLGGGAAARSVDMTYKLLEESTAEMAERVGNPALKVTNLKDNLREGDVAAMVPEVPNNSVGAFMREAKGQGINYGWQGGPAYNDTARPLESGSGRFSGPANLALGAVQGDMGTTHAETMARMTAAGQLNRPGRVK